MEIVSLLLIIAGNLLVWGIILWTDIKYKEPAALLFILLIGGMLSCHIAGVIDRAGYYWADSFLKQGSALYAVVKYILVVGIAEEGVKLFFTDYITWNNSAFDSKFDAIVYNVTVATGFSFVEDYLYVFKWDPDMLGTAIGRAKSEITGHVAFAMIVGLFYGWAREQANYGHKVKSLLLKATGFALAVIAHGINDIIAENNDINAGIIGYIFRFIIIFTVFYAYDKFNPKDRDLHVKIQFRREKTVKAKHINMLMVMTLCFGVSYNICNAVITSLSYYFCAAVIIVLIILFSLYNFISDKYQLIKYQHGRATYSI